MGIVEQRRYRAVPGKREEILGWFDRVWLGLFERRGVPAGPILLERDDPDAFRYDVHWADAEQMAAVWGAFAADPEWIESRAACEAGGPLFAQIESVVLERRG